MIVFKAFKNNELVQGGKRFEIGVIAQTQKPCVLRVSGLHVCATQGACRKYYPENPVIVQCEVQSEDIVDNNDGVMVVKKLLPLAFVNPRYAPLNDSELDDEEETEHLDGSPEAIANELRRLADRIETNF